MVIVGMSATVVPRSFCYCLNPKSMQNNSPKPIIAAIKAILLRTFGVQVGVPSSDLLLLAVGCGRTNVFY